MKKFLLTALCSVAALGALADQPFRDHRYDSFKATPTEPGQIVFAGNSITNMHSWFEAFGSHQKVVGRGNSGGFAYELLDNLESYIDSKPSKLFVMIGTNDVSSGQTAEITARRIEAIVQRTRLESPDTEIYIESILPRSNNAKTAYETCNTLVREWIAGQNDPKVHAINLSTVCAKMGESGRTDWAADGLHPTVKGYTAWTHHIENEVGYASVYPSNLVDDATTLTAVSGFGGVLLERTQQFEYFPVKEGDVLFFGDEQIHGGEWHELLRSDKVKDRGMFWGWGGLNLTAAKEVISLSLRNQAVKPAKIFLFYGVGEQDATKYAALVDEAKAQAPNAQIYCVATSPSANSATNTTRVNFNAQIKTVAEQKGATYVDAYTPLAANVGANIMNTNYISGRGYVVMANALAPYVGASNPVSLDEYTATYTRRTNRKIIGDALTQAFMRGYKADGTLRTECSELPAKISAAVAAVNSDDLTEAKANEVASAITSYLDDALITLKSGWYVIQSADNGHTDYIINADAYAENDGIFHNQYGCAPLVFSPSAVDGPQGWVYINIAGGNYQLEGINGWYIGDKSIGSRTAYNTMLVEGTADGTYIIPGWAKFTAFTASHAGSLPIVGGSGSANFAYSLTAVPAAEVSKYDVWTVNITDNVAGSTVESLYLDTRVTLNCPENKGNVTTVYNRGKFFLTPGTQLFADMVTVHTNAATSALTNPLVTIDNEARTITVTNNAGEEDPGVIDKTIVYVPVTDAKQLVHGGRYQIRNHNANWTAAPDHYLTCTNGTVNWVVAPSDMTDTYWTLEEDLDQNGTVNETYPNRWYRLNHAGHYFNYDKATVSNAANAHAYSFIHRSLWPDGFTGSNMNATETGDFFTMSYKNGDNYYTLGVGTNFNVNEGLFTENRGYTWPYYNASWSFVHSLYQVVHVDYERITDLSQISADDRYVLVVHNIRWDDKAVTFNADGTRALTPISTVMADPRAALLQLEPVEGSNDYLVRNAGRYMRFLQGDNYNATVTEPVNDSYIHFNKTSLPSQYVTADDDVDGVYFEVLYRSNDSGTYVYSGCNAEGTFGQFSSNRDYYNNNTGYYSLYFQLYRVNLEADDAYTAAAETYAAALHAKNNIGDEEGQYRLTTEPVAYYDNLLSIGNAATSDLATSAIVNHLDNAVAAYKDENDYALRGNMVVSSIDEIAADAPDAPVYDLYGRRVANPTRGIYIQGSRKFILK